MPEGGDAIGNIPLDLPAEYIERGLTIGELEAMSGVGVDTIRAIETGLRAAKPATRAKIRKALDAVEPIKLRPVNQPVDGWRDPLRELAQVVVKLERRLLDVEQQLHELRVAKRRRPPGDSPQR